MPPSPAAAPSWSVPAYAPPALLLALMLLAAGLAWPVPMMAWDHLDLVPLLARWHAGELGAADLFAFHGGHWHGVAYALLLATTLLSGGLPQADIVLSTALLSGYAALLWTRLPAPLRTAAKPAVLPLLLLFLLLYPGHLANLQWGWQVAVFACLAGFAAMLALLCSPHLDGARNALAIAAALLSLGSFATGLAGLPVALLLLALRRDLPAPRRVRLALPWLAAIAVVAAAYAGAGSERVERLLDPLTLAHYTLNFLGSALLRPLTDIAPLAALAVGVHVVVLLWRAPPSASGCRGSAASPLPSAVRC